jgi:hypothetical protein
LKSRPESIYSGIGRVSACTIALYLTGDKKKENVDGAVRLFMMAIRDSSFDGDTVF